MSAALPAFADIAAAALQIAPVAVETPLLDHPELDRRAGARCLVKAECLQVTGSFKIRGAMNRLAQSPRSDRPAGVVAFSSGNHAQGIARAARHFAMPALIVMPEDAPRVKADGVRAEGAEIRPYDREHESREEIAASLARAHGAILVPSFDDPAIIAGQGTVGLEIARQAAARGEGVDHLICCTGGGGLISGIALAMEALSPGTRIWTAEPEGHDDWRRSLEAGTPIANPPGTRSICDAILTPQPGELTWAVAGPRLSGGFAVSDEAVCEAIGFAIRHLKVVLEPGGAVALAVALQGLPEAMRGGTVVLVASGGNIDPGLLAGILSDGAT